MKGTKERLKEEGPNPTEPTRPYRTFTDDEYDKMYEWLNEGNVEEVKEKKDCCVIL
jgi:hypothetical protein